jgi:hypothetical protein
MALAVELLLTIFYSRSYRLSRQRSLVGFPDISSSRRAVEESGGQRAGGRSRLRYGRRMGSPLPGIDAGARQRLTARFGSEVEAWFDELPGVLAALAKRWQFELGSPDPARHRVGCLLVPDG